MHTPNDQAALPALGLQHPQVRDLAWACFAPLMLLPPGDEVSAASFPLTPARKHWLQVLENDPRPLMTWLQAHPATRLGVYFERLWQFFLRADSETELIANNLAVRNGGQTLGEFDCLYWCHRRGTAVHLELAVKFYLGCGTPPVGAAHSAAHDWLGPNTVDRLDRKLQRLLEHQIQLSRHPAANSVLAALNVVAPRREIALSGCLFAPSTGALPPPAGYNPRLPLGRWYRLQDWLARCSGKHVVIPRLKWLAPMRAASAELNHDGLAAHLVEHFQRGGRPQLLAALDAQGNEYSRCFVTSDDWPKTLI